MSDAAVLRLLKELRRRRVFRVAGLYVVSAWLALQAANILFPGWGIPDEAIRYLFWAALAGFPVALVFGWIFQITSGGIQRTPPQWSDDELHAAIPLKRMDYLILAAFVTVVGLIVYDATSRVLRTAPVVEERAQSRPAEVMENSVAVLPFASLSPDPEHEYFADGISEEILNRLSAFGELTVIARTSSFAFKDSGYDVARISGLLGVEYLLQGSIRRDNGQIRIAAQLLNQRGAQLWTQTFDRPLGAIFALQDEIAEAVATNIAPQIVPPPAEERLPDLVAYDAYLAGRELVARRASGWVARAPVHFDRAIEFDPQFAEPYAERAVALAVRAQWAPDATAEFERAQRDIDTALALKPGLARAYAAQALLLFHQRPGSDAEQVALLRRALAADPNHVDAMNWLTGALSRQGRGDEADEIMQRALRLDPVAPVTNATWAYREAQHGRWTEAEQRLLRMLELPQVSINTLATLIDLYRQSGRLVEATEVHKRTILEIIAERGRAPDTMRLIEIYSILGLVEQAEDWRERSILNFPGLDMMRLYELEALSLRSGARDYAMTLGEVETIIEGMAPDLADIPRDAVMFYGSLRALAGDAEGAIRVLAPLHAEGDVHRLRPLSRALAWAYLQAGDQAAAAALLEPVDRDYREREAAGRLHFSVDLAHFALNTLLLGDPERALELLARAAEAGWRDYCAAQRDPRWNAVRARPEFQAIMTQVKADLDLQRAQLEAIDAEDDFIARYEAALVLHADKVEEAEP